MDAALSLDTIDRHGKTPKRNAADASNTFFFIGNTTRMDFRDKFAKATTNTVKTPAASTE
jgi:hypothetical protein